MTEQERAERAAAIRRIVDAAPRLTDERRARLAGLLRPALTEIGGKTT